MRDNMTKDTWITLKKLKVVNEAAKKEMDRLEAKEKEKVSDFESDFWFDSDHENAKNDVRLIHLKYPLWPLERNALKEV